MKKETGMSAEPARSAEDIPHPSEWPVEMCQDGWHRSIRREDGLVLYGVSSNEDFVQNYARDHDWNDFVLKLCAHRFAELVEEGAIAPDVTPEP